MPTGKACCPRSERAGRQAGQNWSSSRTKWLLPLAGFTALLWYLVRVLPKPSRAAYPCQRAAAPMAASFISYGLGWAALLLVFRKATYSLIRFRNAWIGVCAVLALASAIMVYALNAPVAIAPF